jgi:hypothetical protein
MADRFGKVTDPDDGPDVSTASGLKVCLGGAAIDRFGRTRFKPSSSLCTDVIRAVYLVIKMWP